MPGALSQGDTGEETLRNIQEAMELWDETMAEKGRGPLEETPELIAAEVAFVFDWRAEEGWSFELETATVVLAA